MYLEFLIQKTLEINDINSKNSGDQRYDVTNHIDAT